MRALNPAFLLLLAATHATCRRSLTADYRGELPRTANQPDRLPGSEAVLGAADVPLGSVVVTLAGKANVTDDNALRAAVLSGVASSTDWLSVGDASAIGVTAGRSLNTSAPTTTPPCGTTAPSLTYTIALAPAVLPTAAQARQLTDGAAGWIGGQLQRARLKDYRVVGTDVKLDDTLFAKQPAPFPQSATAASTNTLLGLLRASGVGMSLCDVGLAALRTLQREDLVTTMEQIERSAANGTVTAVGARKPRRFHNVANTRFTGVLPQRPDVNPAYVTVDTPLPPGGVDVMDITMVIAGLTRDEALRDLDSIRGVARLGRYTRELARTPGLSAASVGPAPRDWLYNGATLESDGGISSGALAAAIVVPTVAGACLCWCVAAGGGESGKKGWPAAARSVAVAAAATERGVDEKPGSASGTPTTFPPHSFPPLLKNQLLPWQQPPSRTTYVAVGASANAPPEWRRWRRLAWARRGRGRANRLNCCARFVTRRLLCGTRWLAWPTWSGKSMSPTWLSPRVTTAKKWSWGRAPAAASCAGAIRRRGKMLRSKF